jgi:hypothetical protein
MHLKKLKCLVDHKQNDAKTFLNKIFSQQCKTFSTFFQEKDIQTFRQQTRSFSILRDACPVKLFTAVIHTVE